MNKQIILHAMCGLFASECTCLFGLFFFLNEPKSPFPVAKLPFPWEVSGGFS